MAQEKTTLEVIAPSVEEAIADGLQQLGLSRESVDVDVLDSGSKGLFGLGSRLARVRLKMKESGGAEAESEVDPAYLASLQNEGLPASKTTAIPSDDEFELQVSAEVVRTLLDKMKVRAKVNSQFVSPVDDRDQRLIQVEVLGDDLSILIGRRSETLNALQYISSLIVCKQVGHWVPLMIDVQGYRLRRERQLRQLATRIAEQAITTGKRQILEPMPANERRIIHLELRDHPDVLTESMGDEPNRKVTISLKKKPK
ncbi:MAG: KH domain-containing protein [Anaerolineaceae bacterium]|nr:KH domain-containing protein [Anaerolineaceae bacterium]NTV36512.1 KH domain-containing protein [Anaerolineaceae bacterium]